MGFRVQGLGFGVSGLAHEDAMGRARVRVSICTYVRIYVCMYVGMHVCMYACMHVCMYVRMYVCVLAIYIYIYIYINLWLSFNGRGVLYTLGVRGEVQDTAPMRGMSLPALLILLPRLVLPVLLLQALLITNTRSWHV